jgi:uncharacterized protein DUF6174
VSTRHGVARLRSVGLAAALLVLAATCEDAGSGPDALLLAELETARARWEERGYTDYALTLQRDCFCGETFRGPVVVQVRFEEVVARVYVSTGQPVPEEAASWFPDVEGLFDFLDDALHRDPHEIRVEYHPELGYPTEFFVDFSDNIADEEQGYRVLGLEPTR